MKVQIGYFATIFFTFLGLAQKASAILCYDCNSLFDPRCGENFDPFSLGIVNCSLRDPLDHMPELEPTICRTIKMEINEKVRVVRSCGYIKDENEEKPCVRKTSTDKLFVTYCSCSTDLCNGAEELHLEISLVALLVSLYFMV